MGEANFYYFTCLNCILEKAIRISIVNKLCQDGSTTLPPPSHVLPHAEQQASNFQNAWRKARLSLSEESREDPSMRRYRRQAPGYQARSSRGVEKHAQKTQAGLSRLWR